MPFNVGPTTATEVGTSGSAASKVLNTAQMSLGDTLVTFSWQVLSYLAGCSNLADLRVYAGLSSGAFTTLIDSLNAVPADGLVTRTYDLTAYAGQWITMFFQSPFSAPCQITVAGSMATGSRPVQALSTSTLGCDTCAGLAAISADLAAILAAVRKTY